MKTESLYIDLLKGFFIPFVGAITEKDGESGYLHDVLLGKEFSPSMSWDSTGVSNAVVSADVVSLESSLPLRGRPAISVARGEIPKIGVKFGKGEKELNDINIMLSMGANKAQVRARLLDDVPKAVKAVKQRVEIMFQEALSTGVTVTSSENNAGVGIRVDYGFTDTNTVNTETSWSETNATPLSDLVKLFDKANDANSSLGILYLGKKAFNQIRASKEGKELVKSFLGLSGTALPNPSKQNMMDALKDEFGVDVVIVDKTYSVVGGNGAIKTYRPFSDEYVVATPATTLGRVVYGKLAEETLPVAGVSYAKSGEYTLVSKYANNDPLEEFTSAQACVIPVLDAAQDIYRVKVVK